MSMILNTYKLKDTSKDGLYKNGWHYSHKYSNSDDTYYTYTFNAYKSLIECEFIVNQASKIVDIEVKDIAGNTYPPFYNRAYGSKNLVVMKIEDNIKKRMRRLGIKREY